MSFAAYNVDKKSFATLYLQFCVISSLLLRLNDLVISLTEVCNFFNRIFSFGHLTELIWIPRKSKTLASLIIY